MALETPAPENWGDVGELGFTTIPEADKDKPKNPEDPDSPELAWTDKVKGSFKTNHPDEESDQLPN